MDTKTLKLPKSPPQYLILLIKKLTDLIHYVKPASTLMLKKIDEDLEVIKKCEQDINSRFKSVVESKQDVTN
jgi:hypothetical protein